MKIIGISKNENYICEIGKTEIEKFLNLYYGHMKALKIGDEINLGRGYDFSRETKEAMETTQNFIKDNSKTVEAILGGLRFLNLESNPMWHEGDPCVHCGDPHDEVEKGECPGPTKKMKRK